MLNTKTKWAIFTSFLAIALPIVTQAATKRLDLYNPRKSYKDEKVDPTSTASRCTTAAFQKMHADAEAQAQKELAKLKGAGTSEQALTSAFKTYEQDLEMAWSAMQEPYCGFGAFGATAAKKSYQKTLTRAHTNFLARVKSGVVTSTPVASIVTNVILAADASTTAPAVPVVAPASIPSSVALPPPAKAAIRISHSLERGERSEEVQRLQNLLVKKGLLDQEFATGYFGDHTESAIVSFQQSHHIISKRTSFGAGIVGPKTRKALDL